MTSSTECISANVLTNSNIRLAGKPDTSWRENSKNVLKQIKSFFRETTVEPCLFIYQLCIALSSIAVQNMHLEKSCRVNFQFGDEICDRIRDRNTTGLEEQLNAVHSLVAKVVAWKFPLQTAIPAVMVLFVGAWSDKYRRRKFCILLPMTGEICTNIGLLLATYYFYELSLIGTALIEALPAAFTGSYIFVFMGMYSFMTDRTSVKNRTFRLGIVAICVNLGTPAGTALSGPLLRILGYYGMFSLILALHCLSFTYGMFRLEDVCPVENETSVNKSGCELRSKLREVFGLVAKTVLVILKPRPFRGRVQIFAVLALYLIMVGPLYGDSQVGYLYAIRKFSFNEVEYSVYGAINIVLGLIGTFFCISFLSKRMQVQDSVIGALAGVSRIAACFVFAFAPTRPWFYSAPLFNIFSHCSLTAIRSMATKSVLPEEVAKLNAVIGVTEALAPSIYMPTSSYIYVSTIDYLPGAFYLFDAALTLVALGLFAFVYILVRRRDRDCVKDPARKEEFARSNEVARF
ncbi:uncharacterized protein LOC126374271 [Pectinophora gossypiella]|nr:uncharacterized protein LOC126374271 [Pectinophora gossypiella]